MMNALGNAYMFGELQCDEILPTDVEKVISIQNALIDQAVSSSNYDYRFKYSMDKAQVFRISCKRQSCLDLLNDVITWATGDDNINATQKFICDVSMEMAVLDGSIPLENIEQEISTCNQGSSERMREPVEEPNSKLVTESNVDSKVWTNYQTQMLEVNTSIESGRILLINPLGEVVFQGELNYETSIDYTNLSKGVYLLKIENLKGDQMKCEKVMLP